MRREQALPILEKLQRYLQEQRAAALPKSPLGAAIGYALRNWLALTRYAEDGRLKIDNNGAEQALRPFVLGRKNWLFAGSEAAAHRTAILCSLVQTCKHLQINPFVYLRDVIERVSTHPARLVLGADAARVEAPAAIPERKPPPERGLRAGHWCVVSLSLFAQNGARLQFLQQRLGVDEVRGVPPVAMASVISIAPKCCRSSCKPTLSSFDNPPPLQTIHQHDVRARRTFNGAI